MEKRIIEIAGEAVGALLPHAHGLRFLAVKFNVWPLDGSVYADHQEASRAITAHIAATRDDGPAEENMH